MHTYEDIIGYIQKVKDNLNNSVYSSGKDLETDFYRINKLTGTRTNNMKHENLNDIFKLHEFLISEVCKIHAIENDSFNESLLKNNINIKELNQQLNDGKRAFNIYSFNDSSYDYYFIGDLHSDTISLNKILQVCDFFNIVVKNKKKRLIFLGDYVDRGKAHIKMLEYILILKFMFPNNIYLLKGNHDDGMLIDKEIKLPVRKPEDESDDDYFLLYVDKLLKSNSSLTTNIINEYLNFFNSLCNIAFVTNKHMTLLAVHGGIPRPRKDDLTYYKYITSISDLTNDNIIDNINKTITNNMVWSDPCVDENDLREDVGRFRFTIDHFNEFQNIINFDLLIRGHEAEINGYKKFFNDRLFTLFSSGAILENNININNETAYKKIMPKIIQFNKNNHPSLVDLI